MAVWHVPQRPISSLLRIRPRPRTGKFSNWFSVIRRERLESFILGRILGFEGSRWRCAPPLLTLSVLRLRRLSRRGELGGLRRPQHQ